MQEIREIAHWISLDHPHQPRHDLERKMRADRRAARRFVDDAPMDFDPWRPIANGRYLGTDPSKRFPIYTRGNAGEVFPEVQYPLSFTSSRSSGVR